MASKKQRPAWLKRVVNSLNDRIATAPTDEQKAALCLAIEDILFEHGSYRGYQHRYWVIQGCEEWEAAGKPDDNIKYVLGPKFKFDHIYY